MAVPVGSVIGMSLTGFLFDEQIDVKAQMQTLFLRVNVIMTLIFVVFVMTFRDKPEHPPSAAATMAPPKKDFSHTYNELRANKNFIVISVYYFFMFGLYATFGNLMSEIFRPFGLKIYEMAALGVLGLMCGVVGSLIFGGILDRTKSYKFFMQLIPFLIIVDLLFFVFYALPEATVNDKLPILVTTLFFCISLLPVIPLTMQFSVEVTFPLNASTANGFCLLLGHAGSFICSVTATYLTKQDWTLKIDEETRIKSEQQEAREVMLMLIFLAAVSLCLSFFVDEDLRRSRFGETKTSKFEEMKEVKEDSETADNKD